MYAYACYMYEYNITCRYMYTYTPAFYVLMFEYLSSYICEFFFFFLRGYAKYMMILRKIENKNEFHMWRLYGGDENDICI